MSMAMLSGRGWKIDVSVDWIDVTSERATPNERWTHTDAAGHEHRYERGYPTLRLVVDASHWCDGTEGLYNHDPHEAVDESHYECLRCGETIEPAMDPPYTPKRVRGATTATIEARVTPGETVRALLLEAEYERLTNGEPSEAEVMEVVRAIPDERVMERTFSTM